MAEFFRRAFIIYSDWLRLEFRNLKKKTDKMAEGNRRVSLGPPLPILVHQNRLRKRCKAAQGPSTRPPVRREKKRQWLLFFFFRLFVSSRRVRHR